MKNIKLDKDWILLIEELQKAGISKEEFKAFLELKKTEKENK
ncbi:hypothetical protein AB1283_03520 [Bacillus sp. S13(2024)]